jgi:hypothetical protein
VRHVWKGIAAALLIGALPPAGAVASVTVGSPLNSPTATAVASIESTVWVQSERMDPRLASPVNGTVVVWRVRGTFVNSSPNTVRLQVLQPVGTGFLGVGSSPQQTLPNGGNDDVIREFSVSIPISVGDHLGLGASPNAWAPQASTPGTFTDGYHAFNDGDTSGTLTGGSSGELQLNADVSPTNSFSLSPSQANRKNGTATLTATLSNPGTLLLSGALVIPQALTGSAEGPLGVSLAPSKSTRKRLKKKGKASGQVDFTFTPSFGTPATQSLPVALALKRTKRHKVGH